MSSSKRHSTVHDFASLRLRPDGSRITRKQTEGKSQKYATYTVQDHRGNWIAKDAGGIGRVKTRYSARKDAEEGEHEEAEGEEVDESQVAGPSTADKGKGRALEDDLQALKDSRAKRRRLFVEDIGIHHAEASSLSRSSAPAVPGSGETGSGPHARPNPSSDLLKCIHYFASTYYSEMGQLRDVSKEYRQEKKQRRLKRLEDSSARRATKRRSVTQEREGPQGEDSEQGSSEEETSDDSEEATDGPRKISKRRQARPLVGTDMYKLFDGSALMAIGMLLQHHVEGLVAPRIPEGWEEEMECSTEQPLTKTTQLKRVKSHESSDFAADTLLRYSEEPLDIPADGGLHVYDDSEDEDYVPE
ncbi:hypothetical protein PsYK624_035800 [Phanerochaete sordida]|uniref:Uncharacterized protein n=1 Tax=Phanerochaete sordida TaxID=48140 RepID=A0A9P3G3N0_9APHY|nr:hypothetical protein PsYK624_035800 [Phanerochaete sordida]